MKRTGDKISGPRYRVHAIICHGKNDEMWSTVMPLCNTSPMLLSSHQCVPSKATITTQKYEEHQATR